MTTAVALPDVNVLIALVSEQHTHFAAAHRWFSSTEAWATTPITEAGLLRLLLNPSVVGGRITGATALDLLSRLRRQRQHHWIADDSSLTDPRIDLSALVGHRQITDLHLVNLAARTGARLVTFNARLVRSLAPEDQVHVDLLPI